MLRCFLVYDSFEMFWYHMKNYRIWKTKSSIENLLIHLMIELKLYKLPFIFDCYLWNNNLMLRQAVLILVWDVLLPRKKNVEHAQITWWIFSIFWAKGITTHLHHSITKTKAISLLYSKIGMCVWLH